MVKRITLFLLAIMLPFFLFSQTTGKIAGTVTSEETGEPIMGANVVVTDAAYPIGAASGQDGYFVILNVPPGNYTVRVTYMGKKDVILQDVPVSSGRSTNLEIEMENRTLEGQSVVVQAQRKLVNTDATSSESISTAEDIEKLPIRGIGNVAANSAGVVAQDGDLHFRGGREDEVNYLVNGVSTRNPVSNNNVVRVLHEAIQEVSVLTGGYTADQGAANSGIVSTKLKTGSPDFHGSIKAKADGFGNAEDGDKFLDTYSYGHQSLIATIGGPIISDKATFFLAGEYRNREDAEVRYSKGFEFNDLVDMNPSNPTPRDTVDLSYPDGFTPLQSSESYTINGTVTLDLPIRVTMTGLYTSQTWDVGSTPMLDILNDRTPYNTAQNGLFTIKLTKQFSSKSFLEVNGSYIFDTWETNDGWFDDDWHSWYDSAAVYDHSLDLYGGDSSRAVEYRNAWQDKFGYVINGFPMERNGNPRGLYGTGSQEGMEFGADYKGQFGRHHQVKIGGNFKTYTCRYFDISPGVMVHTAPVGEDPGGYTSYGSIEDVPYFRWMSTGDVDAYGYDIYGNEIDERKDYYNEDGELDGNAPAPKKPIEMAAYVMDKIEFNDLVINAGLRLDYFDPDDRELKNPADPEVNKSASMISEDAWQEIDPYIELSPRLGFSFPTGPASHFYLYYGKFVQMPAYNNIYFSSNDYAWQVVRQGFYFINPIGFGLEPTYTTQYEIGYKRELTNNIALNATAFYKNQKGLIQSKMQQIEPDAYIPGSYIRFFNGDFATHKGLELRLEMRRINRLAGRINYTYTDAEGTASNNTAYHAAVYMNTVIPKTINPLRYGVKHNGSINLDYRFGDNDGGPILENFGVNVLMRFTSGHPYTRVYVPGAGQADPYNAGVEYLNDSRNRTAVEPVGASTTPWTFVTDLRAEKTFTLGNFDATIFVLVNNLFDRRNVQNVYPLTGSAEDDGLISDPAQVEQMIKSNGEMWKELYQAINIENGQSYWNVAGRELWGNPRQIHFGLEVEF